MYFMLKKSLKYVIFWLICFYTIFPTLYISYFCFISLHCTHYILDFFWLAMTLSYDGKFPYETKELQANLDLNCHF